VGTERRTAARQAIALPGRLTWKDARGAIRFASIQTRNLTDDFAFVECLGGSPIPLYRLVQLQIDQQAQVLPPGVPSALGRGKVLSAVYRVGPSRPATGLPEGYALRLLVPPGSAARASAKASFQALDDIRSIA